MSNIIPGPGYAPPPPPLEEPDWTARAAVFVDAVNMYPMVEAIRVAAIEVVASALRVAFYEGASTASKACADLAQANAAARRP